MSTAAVARVRTARMQLLLAAFASAMLWGILAALTVLLLFAAVDLLVAVPLHLRQLGRPLAVLVFLIAAALTLWRARATLSMAHVSLWLEERVPSLRYALVTAVELGPGTPAELHSTVAAHRWDTEVARAAARAIATPLAPLLLGFVLLALLPPGAMTRVSTPHPGDSLERGVSAANPTRSLLTPLTVTVQPPAYASQRERVLDDPVTVEGLPGSRIALRGRGDYARVSASIEDRRIAAVRERDRWRLDFSLPARPMVVRLSDGQHQRLLTVEPRMDEAPAVTLVAPERDTVLRAARGVVRLEAQLRDDIGVARGAFEYIVSSGSGELFNFRSGTIGAAAGAGAREMSLRATLSLDSLRLDAGDVVHLRAVGWDANDVSGPGMGVSETRAIRVARADEYDTVAVEGAPPPDLDADAVSQRMLIIQTERLEAARRRIARDSLVRASRQLAQRQNLLRRRVAEIVFMRLGMQPDGEHSHGPGDGHDHSEDELMGYLTPERLLQEAGAATAAQGAAAMTGHGHDESPILSINQPLLEAYNHMWEASGELEIGEPARALPPMRRALEALQKAREAERYYLRGRSPRVVVDIARVRLASPQQVSPAGRRALPVGETSVRRLSDRLLAAVELLGSTPDAAADSLLVIRVDALQHAPAAATALGEALQALRTGRDATEALVRARRAFDGAARVSEAGAWRGAW